MKSRISFFNGTAFKKNLTRFAPVWGLYTVGLLMCLVLMLESGVEHWLYSNIAESLNLMPLANLGYALICAQLLFGDLYSARMCNALHAMPVRREGWFVTNLTSGLVFSFLPTAVMALGAVALSPFSQMVNAWQIPLYWWLASNLQFLCFFGLAVFSAFCVGNRFAQAMVYGILNFASTITYWLVDTLYTPLFYGVKTAENPFTLFCPFVSMIDCAYIDCNRILDYEKINEAGYTEAFYHGEFTLESGWWYLWVCAAVGVVLMLVALQMYRKRKLETAGDFMAIRGLEPVFQVVYTMVVGTLFQFVVDDMFGLTRMPIFLVFGLAVGWFTGRMLLERNIRVFHKKSWLGFVALAAAFGLTLGIAIWDPMGIETWIPEVDEVASVTVSTGHGAYHSDEITLEDTADIEVILAIHAEALEERIDEISWITQGEEGYQRRENMPVTIEYRMEDGSTRSRYYYYWADEGGALALEPYFSSVEAVFGTENPDLDALQETGLGWWHEDLREVLENADFRPLMDAIVADCEAGTMAQNYVYHRNEVDLFNLSLQTQKTDAHGNVEIIFSREITIHSDNENCVAWLEAQGVDVQAIVDEYFE